MGELPSQSTPSRSSTSATRRSCQTRGVARFEPFPALRYDLTRAELADLIAPPYDVIDAEDRKALVATHENNAVVIDLPDEADGDERYEIARSTLARWIEEGVLV